MQQVGFNRSLCNFWTETQNVNFAGFLGYLSVYAVFTEKYAADRVA